MQKRWEKAVENVYSLKKQRTISYKLDQVIHKNSLTMMRPLKNLKVSRSSQFDICKPIDSFASMTSGKKHLSDLYRSRILPSQHLSTPFQTLEKLTKNVYSYRGVQETAEIIAEIAKTTDKSPLVCAKDKKKRTLSLGITEECNDLLKENMNSKRHLKAAKLFLDKRADLTTKLIKLCEETGNQGDFHQFQQKLRDAHYQLVKKNRIRPRLSNVSKENL